MKNLNNTYEKMSKLMYSKSKLSEKEKNNLAYLLGKIMAYQELIPDLNFPEIELAFIKLKIYPGGFEFQ